MYDVSQYFVAYFLLLWSSLYICPYQISLFIISEGLLLSQNTKIRFVKVEQAQT